MAASLPYHEPGIVPILILSAFLLALNAVNWIFDRVLYCGLVGQVFLGVAWGTPGAKWLSDSAEEVFVQLGYLGLILLVYEGGLSTSFASLRANLLLSIAVALTGIAAPIALSFILKDLVGATSLQAFAAGAALCSTSLGTTFTVLTASGLTSTRLGVVLTSAAMMDDVVGLVMVQVISNLGASPSFNAVTIIRPVFVSLALAAIMPFLCAFIVKPAASMPLWRSIRSRIFNSSLLTYRQMALVCHTPLLVATVAGASYAGTSNLFAAYLAGAAISWWDSQAPAVETSGNPAAAVPFQFSESTGLAVYGTYFHMAVDNILKPLFFASIGFSIPITRMFKEQVVWRGIVYALLMSCGKLFCGLWLIRFSSASNYITELRSKLGKFHSLAVPHMWGRLSKPREGNLSKKERVKPAESTNGESSDKTSPDAGAVAAPSTRTPDEPPHEPDSTVNPTERHAHTSQSPRKPVSLYPAAILGVAMVARGEIGFLIASVADSNGIFGASEGESEVFLVVIWAIMLCTILGPVTVGALVKRVRRLQREGSERSDALGVWGVS